MHSSGSSKTGAGSASLLSRLHRYRTLISRYWWVLVLTLSAALFVAAWLQMTRPLTYLSMAQTSVDMEHATSISVGTTGTLAFGQLSLDDFMSMQRDAIKDKQITKMAADRLQVLYPDMPPSTASLSVIPQGPTFNFNATGPNPVYVQRYLQSVVDAYLQYRKNLKTSANSEAAGAVERQVPDMEAALKKDDDAILRFQQEHNTVFGKAGSEPDELAALRTKLGQLNDRYTDLTLRSSEHGSNNTARGGASAQGAEDNGSDGVYRQAQLDLVRLQAQLDDLSRDLRPKHPKILDLRRQIDAENKLIASQVDQNRADLQDQRDLIASSIQETKNEIAQAEPKAQAKALLQVEFDKLQETKDRDAKTLADLQTTLKTAAIASGAQVDPVHMTEPASPAIQIPSSWLKFLSLALVLGLASGAGILALIDRMDDRMNSVADLQAQFAETVVGQIPRDASAEQGELLRPDDQRHQLVESYRNLRSTLLYMPMDGARPKTVLVTSAIPNEGKSTVSSNLALVMAFAGMKTLLIDGDLRRGELHNAFGVSRDPGFTDVLGHSVNWKIAIRNTSIENLHILPRGRNVPQPSEYLLNKNTDELLKELYPLYDYIIIDSSPVLAADDTASLAPKIDSVLFVVRLGFTPAKMTRRSLEVLHGRQANVAGLILNQVDTSSPEFVYYQYSEYYHAMTPEEEGSKKAKKPSIEVV